MNTNKLATTIKKFKKLNNVNPDRILLMIMDRENRGLVKELLEQNYNVIIPESEEEFIDKSFDLVLVDEYILNKYEKILQKIRYEEKPVFLPILLLMSQNNKSIIYKKLQTIVNDLVRIPVSKVILKKRIKNLLHIRRLSLESDQRYHALAEKSPVGICILQRQKIVYANPVFINICGEKNEDIFASPFLNFVYEKDRQKIKTLFKNINSKKTNEIRIVKGNEIRWVEFNFASIIYKDEESILITILDITEKKRSIEEIKYLNYHDKLTGLYNHNFFEEEIERLDTQRQLPLSLIMGDVNGLKLVNDAFGHKVGNQLLKKISNILKQTCRKEDIIARWGGDEFVILLPRTSNEDGTKICSRIRKLCAKAQQKPIRLSIALGVATKINMTTDVEEVLKKAEDRMYKNKIAGTESVRNSIISSLENTLLEKSHETRDHAERMYKIALEFGEKLNLSTSILNELKLLTKLHDIGKVSIPEKILKKPDKLTKKEYEIIKGHPESGYRIVKEVPELAPVAESILAHHERWDGTGYPQGLSGENIPYTARIISIVDSYDVMTHKRVYKSKLSKKEAINEMKRCAGQQFDPELIKVFINMLVRDA